jgi:glycerol-3-phosphate dehydrogenase
MLYLTANGTLTKMMNLTTQIQNVLSIETFFSSIPGSYLKETLLKLKPLLSINTAIVHLLKLTPDLE